MTATERFITGAKRYLGRNVSTVESYRAGFMLWTPSPISWIIKAENITTLRRAAYRSQNRRAEGACPVGVGVVRVEGIK